MAKKWYPVIDRTKCSECGACIERCPNDVYAKGTTRPMVANPKFCTACMACQRVCPTYAIDYLGDTCGDVGCGCKFRV
ncbi:ATP-binding protein [Alkalibacter mobilis]|uniref:ATP-binding protein n=1 Tax=Alkalibacter mobilis TaxID=2787712 RepID=UPI00189F304E|nr:ferredoxin family protein [Alkalibacter mobilis]MBF7095645.1 4Fe-4S binding protein [Alkalibacter mobilis]